MKCPKCGGESEVLETRSTSYGRRRREKCNFCHHRFSTVEITKEEYEFLTGLAKNHKRIYDFVKKLDEVFKNYKIEEG